MLPLAQRRFDAVDHRKRVVTSRQADDASLDGVDVRGRRFLVGLPDPPGLFIARAEADAGVLARHRLEVRPFLLADRLLALRARVIEVAALRGAIVAAGFPISQREGSPQLDSLRGAVGRLEHDLVDDRVNPDQIARQKSYSQGHRAHDHCATDGSESHGYRPFMSRRTRVRRPALTSQEFTVPDVRIRALICAIAAAISIGSVAIPAAF